MFNITGPHHCPKCPPVINKNGRRIDQPLELVRDNYSGCGVDIAHCPTCEANFQISYKVDEIQEINSKGEFVKSLTRTVECCPGCGGELCEEGGHIEGPDDLPCLYCPKCGYVGPDVE